jgi:hypothetical protein
MEAAGSSEAFAPTYQNKRCHIPKNSNLYFIVTIVKPENITYIRKSVTWAVHVERMEEKREAQTILVKKLTGGRAPLSWM